MVGKLAKPWGDHAAGTSVVTPDTDVAVEDAFGPAGFVIVAPVRFEYLRNEGFLEPERRAEPGIAKTKAKLPEPPSFPVGPPVGAPPNPGEAPSLEEEEPHGRS